MPTRRYGEGSVFPDPEGPGWIATIELPPTGDGRRRRPRRKRATEEEAEAALEELRDEYRRTGTVSDPRRRLAEALQAFAFLRAGKRLSDGTREEDQYFAEIIDEGLGGVRLAKLTVHDCDRFLRSISRDGQGRRNIGPAHVAKIRTRLVTVLRNEMRIGNLAVNVAELSDLPTRPSEVDDPDSDEPRALSYSELRSLLGLARGARRVLIDLCGRNGLRPAEARALRWVDVDLEAGELSVRGQQSRSNKRTRTKRAHNAARTIRLDDETIERLKTFKAEQAVIRKQAGPLWTPHGLVATTATGTPIDRRSLARSIRSLCIRAGIEDPVTPYELRHTAISHQADNGRTPWEIADWAGTSEEMISRVYRHRLRRVAPLQPATEQES